MSGSNVLKVWVMARNANYSFIFTARVFISGTMVAYCVYMAIMVLVADMISGLKVNVKCT